MELTSEIQAEIDKARTIGFGEGYKQGRFDAVMFIRENFNGESYAEMWPEDETDGEGSEAEFWMWFNPILDAAQLTHTQEKV